MHIQPPLMTLTRVSRRYPSAMTMAAPRKNMPTPPLVPPAPFITDTILVDFRIVLSDLHREGMLRW